MNASLEDEEYAAWLEMNAVGSNLGADHSAQGAPISPEHRTERQVQSVDEPGKPLPVPVSKVIRDRDGRSALTGGRDGPRHLVENDNGRPTWCVENACIILETHSDWSGALAHDEFAGITMLVRPIPGTTTPRSKFKSRPLVETDITATVRWFNRHGFPRATKPVASDALFAIAAQTVVSPVQSYLEGLRWDGTPRVDAWLCRYCGAEDTELTAKIGKAWLLSAVARAMDPGCKADCVLVLEGRQGAGKSSVFRVLASDEWFCDSLPDMHSKDAKSALLGKWIVEIPELAAMRRSDTEMVKAFISRTSERYRPAYGRTEVIQPRRCVFGGTTNRTDYLTDDTGNRRFWPVQVGHIELAQLQRDRDQIWAEAVVCYRQGSAWWLDAAAEQQAAARVKTRVAEDPWEADVLQFVEMLHEVSTRDVLEGLAIAKAQRTKAEARRISAILVRAGWIQSGRFTGGASKGMARYVPPAEPDDVVDW